MRQFVEPRIGRRRRCRCSPALLVERRAQRRAAAIPGDREQILVGEAEQRAAQHGRQRKIVLRQQQRIGERHQIHHRDMLGEHEAVGAGDLDIFVLQRADDRLEQRAALAHQNQHVAVARGAAIDADRRAGRRPAAAPCARCAAPA